MKKLTFISLFVLLALLLVACGADEPAQEPVGEDVEEVVEEEGAAEPEEEEAAGEGIAAGEVVTEEEEVEIAEFHQAPMLDGMADLPPVEERLPENPQVVTPVESIGEYGGTWFAVSGDGANIGNIKMILYDPPIRWKADYTGYEPGLLSSFEWSDDGTQVTWHFRRGVKWSDGEPFTMADMDFWLNDLAGNADYRVVQWPWWGFNEDGSRFNVEFPDDYTMVMTWAEPRWIAPFVVAQGFWEWEPMMKPRHYLEQFHPDYSDDGDFEDLEAADKWWQNPDYPTLFAWDVESYAPGERTVFVRNPYYWKVDTEGNQLPYIDRIDVEIVPDAEVRLLQLSQGKYTASFRGTDNPNDIPFLSEQAEANGYTIHTGAVNGAGGWPCWLINQNFPGTMANPSDADLELGELLRNKTFRQALSHAMNRDRIIAVAWDGIGEPKQNTISPQAWHFNSAEGQAIFDEWAASYTEYDVDLASELLDEAGVVDADGDGVRDLPSGEPLQLVLDLGDWGGAQVSINATEAYAADLEAVGLNVLINSLIGQPDWNLRQVEGLYHLRNCHSSELDLWTFPDWVFPVRPDRSWPMEGKWVSTGGEEGWEPEGVTAQLLDIYNRGLQEPTIEGRHQLVYEAIRIHIEEGPIIVGASGDQVMPVVIANNFHNVPDLVILGPWAPGSPGNLNPSQFWIEGG